jgi:predicted dehydrogenase
MDKGTARPVRIGVIGTGYGAAVALPVYREMPEFEPVAVWSNTRERAASVAVEAGVPTATCSIGELLAVDGLEAVHVAAPVALHAPIAVAAAELGLHVLCEKPLATNLSDAYAIAAAVAAAGVACVVNLGRRFHQTRDRLIAAAREVLGRPRFASISLVHSDHATTESRRFGWVHDEPLGGGRLQAYGAHDLDLALQALGPVDSVAAALDIQVPERSDGGRLRRVTTEDSYALLLRLRSGGLAVVSLSSTAHHERADLVEMYGDRGSVRLDSQRCLWSARGGESLRREGPLTADSRASFRTVAANFCATIRDGAPAVPSIADGLRVQALIDAARRASREREWINLEAVEVPPPARPLDRGAQSPPCR